MKTLFAQAVEDKDYKTIHRFLEQLRFTNGMDYRQIYDRINREIGIDLAEWDELVRETEELHG